MCFNPCYNGSGVRSFFLCSDAGQKESFNPCYNGSGVRRKIRAYENSNNIGFNPCYNGSGVRRQLYVRFCNAQITFQSLL